MTRLDSLFDYLSDVVGTPPDQLKVRMTAKNVLSFHVDCITGHGTYDWCKGAWLDKAAPSRKHSIHITDMLALGCNVP